MTQVSFVVLGAGNRAQKYGRYIQNHEADAKIVAVAEPRESVRLAFAFENKIDEKMCFHTWEAIAACPKMADAVLITTHDAMHVAPVEAFAEKGYHILLEKPMAPDEAGCRRIVEVVKHYGVILSVCHVLRYTPYTQQLVKLIRTGTIGKVIAVQHQEPVGYWHQAHSFVRGNWRSKHETSFMILSKACHDTDWIRLIVGEPCVKVSSFGSLMHFKKEHQPKEATDRCLTCPAHIERMCAYSAKRIYYRYFNEGYYPGWPVEIVQQQATSETLETALALGPYGRCVYACDNDVVDHQIVSMQFAGGQTASFLMTAFSPSQPRKSIIHGTHGMITGDSKLIKIYDYLTQQTKLIDSQELIDESLGGHGGGDGGVIREFIRAVVANDPSMIMTGPEICLETHLIAFAAERARLQGTIEYVNNDCQ